MAHRAGIIGTGGIAGMGILGMHDTEDIGEQRFVESHAGGYEATDSVDLVAVADVDADRVARFGEAWGIPESGQYIGHETMLAAEDLDVVSVCTPTYLHAEHVIDAATSDTGPSVIWCEKPIASSLSDAHAMQRHCAESDVELVINHSFRFTDKLQQLRALFDAGLLGEIKSVNASFRRELLRNSTHLIDTLVYLLDAKPGTVSGYINGENDAVDQLEGDRGVDDAGGGGFVVLDDGTFVTLDCTVAREISSMTIQFIGTEGKLYMNNDDGEWRYWRLEDGSHVEADLPEIDGAWRWDDDYRGSFVNAAAHVEAILEGEAANMSPAEEATRSLEVIIGFYISHFTGSQVSFPLDRPLNDVTVTSW